MNFEVIKPNKGYKPKGYKPKHYTAEVIHAPFVGSYQKAAHITALDQSKGWISSKIVELICFYPVTPHYQWVVELGIQHSGANQSKMAVVALNRVSRQGRRITQDPEVMRTRDSCHARAWRHCYTIFPSQSSDINQINTQSIQ